MVFVAAWADGCLRFAAGTHAVFRPLAATLYEAASRGRPLLCRRRARWSAAGLLYSIFRRATGWDAFIRLCRAHGRRAMAYYYRYRDAVHSERQRFAAPELDDTQLRGRHCVPGSALCFGPVGL